jgi:hypothetical protein
MNPVQFHEQVFGMQRIVTLELWMRVSASNSSVGQRRSTERRRPDRDSVPQPPTSFMISSGGDQAATVATVTPHRATAVCVGRTRPVS